MKLLYKQELFPIVLTIERLLVVDTIESSCILVKRFYIDMKHLKTSCLWSKNSNR